MKRRAKTENCNDRWLLDLNNLFWFSFCWNSTITFGFHYSQVDTLRRKLDKLEEAAEETKETSNESQLTSARAKLARYSSLDNIGSNASNKTKPHSGGSTDGAVRNEDDVFEENNNNSGKQAEIGGYKLNPGLWSHIHFYFCILGNQFSWG